jgi:transcriptional regulator with XRE-family HTH domain
MAFTIANAMPRKKYGKTWFGERLQTIPRARGWTRVQLAKAAETTQQSVSYYEIGAGLPPAPAVISSAQALNVTTYQLLGLEPPKILRAEDVSEARRRWEKFQMISTLPERHQKPVVRLINSLVAASSMRKNGVEGERNGR